MGQGKDGSLKANSAYQESGRKSYSAAVTASQSVLADLGAKTRNQIQVLQVSKPEAYLPGQKSSLNLNTKVGLQLKSASENSENRSLGE